MAFAAKTGERLLLSDEEEAGRKKAEAERDHAVAALNVSEAARKQEAEARRLDGEEIDPQVVDIPCILTPRWSIYCAY